MKYETKVSYVYTALTLRQLQLSVVSNGHQVVLFSERFRQKVYWYIIIKVSAFRFEWCVILIYRLKWSDGAGYGQVTFSSHISCVGVSV